MLTRTDGSHPRQALPDRARSCTEPLTPSPSLGHCFLFQPGRKHCPGAEGRALSFCKRWRAGVAWVHLGVSVRCCATAQKLAPLQQTPFPSSHRFSVQFLLCYKNLFGIFPIGLTLETMEAPPGPTGTRSPAAAFCPTETLSLHWQESDGD